MLDNVYVFTGGAIGRAAGWEIVEISVVGGSVKKKRGGAPSPHPPPQNHARSARQNPKDFEKALHNGSVHDPGIFGHGFCSR